MTDVQSVPPAGVSHVRPFVSPVSHLLKLKAGETGDGSSASVIQTPPHHNINTLKEQQDLWDTPWTYNLHKERSTRWPHPHPPSPRHTHLTFSRPVTVTWTLFWRHILLCWVLFCAFSHCLGKITLCVCVCASVCVCVGLRGWRSRVSWQHFSFAL